MAAKRSAMFKSTRASKDSNRPRESSRRRLGFRAVAIVLAAIGALSLLPALTVQLVSPTKPDRPVPAPTPAAVQAPEPAARASGVDKKGKPSGGAPLKGRPSVGKHRPVGMGKGAGEGGGVTVGMGEQGVGGAGGGVGVRELKEAERPLGGVSEDRGEGRVPETGTISGGMAEAGGGEKGTPQGKGRSLAVRREGEGGELPDGRNRCFIDPDGFHRCYPTVFFFGTSKCGTTSLARWLDAHPATHWVANPRRPHQIEQTGVKEAHVFDDPPKGPLLLEQESLHEKLKITTPKVHADSVVIDYTPHYLAVAETPHRIADMYGGQESGLKFIVTLREPMSRAISSWEFKNEFNPKKGRQEESRTLVKTVRDGQKRASKLSACLDLAKSKGLSPRDRDLHLCNPRKFLEMPLFVSHVGKSMFAIQLERWFDIFGRDNFKVVFTDDMAVKPVEVLEDVLNFLGLDLTSEDESKGLPDLARWKKITGMAYNKTKSKKKDELGNQVTDGVREELHTFFEPHNRALEDLLGRPVPDGWN